MADTEHEEWLREEGERKRLHTHPHGVGKKTLFPDGRIKKPVAGESGEEAQDEADDAADDAVDERDAREREGEQDAEDAA